ncbi:MAG: hypothetical protein A2Y56_02190 [Candidatus Aminicenantes bacterium RBG_13_63_10]|nr:MAG: hypothetical protein A2Y56_02190 [Candidatus Aminicenantes bacterium RBG_13_63_10]
MNRRKATGLLSAALAVLARSGLASIELYPSFTDSEGYLDGRYSNDDEVRMGIQADYERAPSPGRKRKFLS